jgi:branched-chain amino acid transport system substrate-binding protein
MHPLNMMGDWVMKRFGPRTFAVIMAMTALVAACGGSGATPPAPTAANGTPILIGVDYDNSGAASPTSLPTYQAMQVAVDQINQSGGVLNHQPLKLIAQSDGGAPTNAPTVVQSLLDQGAKVIVMASGSGSFLQVKSIIQKAQIVAFSPININPAIPQPPNNDYVYTSAPPSTAYLGLVATAYKKVNVSKPAVIVDNAPASALNVPVMNTGFQQSGLTIVDTETIPTNATDTTAAMARLAAKSPDSVYIATQGGAVDTAIFNGLYQAVPKLPKIRAFNCGGPDDKVTQAAALDGVICLTTVTLDNPRTKAADAQLKKSLGSTYTGLNSNYAQGYGAPYVIAQAIKLGGGADAASINTGMQKINALPAYFGGPTFTLTFSATKHTGYNGDCAYVFDAYKGSRLSGAWKPYQPTC